MYLTKKIYDSFNRSVPKISTIENKVEANKYIEMISDKVQEMIAHEREIGGLIVEKGLYGNRQNIEKIIDGLILNSEEVLDVTIPLNFMIDKSKLKLPNERKSLLLGFYSICESPVLYINYCAANIQNDRYIDDLESLNL